MFALSNIPVNIEVQSSEPASMTEQLKLKAQELSFIALREAEKAEEKRAREKIRQKLQQDKLERRSKLELPRDDLAFVYPATPMIQKEKELLPKVYIT